jgi:transcriptional regulator with XRE-family HTH domain
MNTEQNNENDKQNQARNLYFQTSLTQAQIAALIGVSQKTVSQYINDNQWKLIKQRASQAPGLLIEQMNSELQELNAMIAARPLGQRFPTMQEAGIRRRIMQSIDSVKTRLTAGFHAEVLNNFIVYVTQSSMTDAQTLVRYADKYLKGEMKFGKEPGFVNYNLPGDLNLPDAPTGHTHSGDAPPGDLNKAA